MAARTPTKSTKTAIPQLAWHSVDPAPVVLVTGPEQLLAERAIRAIREKMRDADPSLEVSDIDAGAYAPGELLTLASPSLFAEPRLIRVSQVEKATDAFLEETLGYLNAPADDTVLVLWTHDLGIWAAEARIDRVAAGLDAPPDDTGGEPSRDTSGDTSDTSDDASGDTSGVLPDGTPCGCGGGGAGLLAVFAWGKRRGPRTEERSQSG